MFPKDAAVAARINFDVRAADVRGRIKKNQAGKVLAQDKTAICVEFDEDVWEDNVTQVVDGKETKGKTVVWVSQDYLRSHRPILKKAALLLAIRATKAFQKAYPAIEIKEEEKKKLSIEDLPRKAQKAIHYLNAYKFGTQHAEVIKLVEFALGQKIEPFVTIHKRAGGDNTYAKHRVGIRYEKFAVVVPLANPNGHSYPIGRPCMIQDGYHAMVEHGGTGNNLPDNAAPGLEIRAATMDEVTKFVGDLNEDVLDSILGPIVDAAMALNASLQEELEAVKIGA